MSGHIKFKSVMRVDKRGRIIRLFRIIWERGIVGDGNGYSAKFSVGLCPKLFSFSSGPETYWLANVAGIRLHYQRAYGGRFV